MLIVGHVNSEEEVMELSFIAKVAVVKNRFNKLGQQAKL